MSEKKVSTLNKSDLRKAFIKLKKINYEAFISGDDPDPNFEYTIESKGVRVQSLDIHLTKIIKVKSTDKVYATKLKPFHIEVRAILISPIGNGSIQLKDLDKDKDVFDKPQEFTFDSHGRGGIFIDNVKLP